MEELLELYLSKPNVSLSALLTLWCRYLGKSIYCDPLAEKVAQGLLPLMKREHQNKFFKKILKMTEKHIMVKYICRRAKVFNESIQKFLAFHPKGTVINLACGFSHYDISSYKEAFLFDIDMSEAIIDIKSNLRLQKNYKAMTFNVTDDRWIEAVKKERHHLKKENVLIVAEGLLMYLQPEQVRQLGKKLKTTFPNLQMLCEVITVPFMKKLMGWSMETKYKNEYGITGGRMYYFPSNAGEVEKDLDGKVVFKWSGSIIQNVFGLEFAPTR